MKTAHLLVSDFEEIAHKMHQQKEVIADIQLGYTSIHSLSKVVEAYEQIIKEYIAFRIMMEQSKPETLIYSPLSNPLNY